MQPDDLVNKNIYRRTKNAYQTIAKNIETIANQEGIRTNKPKYKLSFHDYDTTYFSVELRTKQDEIILRVEGQIDQESLPVVFVFTQGPTTTLTQKISEYTHAYLQEQKEILGIEYFF